VSGNKLLAAAVEVQADDIRTCRALEQAPVLLSYSQTNYAAKSWKGERRVCARIEATELGLDIRFVVTQHERIGRAYLRQLYCARAQMENLIKLHKTQLASDGTSCRALLANQMRLICTLRRPAPDQPSHPHTLAHNQDHHPGRHISGARRADVTGVGAWEPPCRGIGITKILKKLQLHPRPGCHPVEVGIDMFTG
jgi:hypothetical protein